MQLQNTQVWFSVQWRVPADYVCTKQIAVVGLKTTFWNGPSWITRAEVQVITFPYPLSLCFNRQWYWALLLQSFLMQKTCFEKVFWRSILLWPCFYSQQFIIWWTKSIECLGIWVMRVDCLALCWFFQQAPSGLQTRWVNFQSHNNLPLPQGSLRYVR